MNIRMASGVGNIHWSAMGILVKESARNLVVAYVVKAHLYAEASSWDW